MKIRMSKTYVVYELYDTIEINKEDYPELIDFSKPTQPLAPTVIQTPNQNKIIQENTESLIQNETVNKTTISNKEETKKLPLIKEGPGGGITKTSEEALSLLACELNDWLNLLPQ